MYRPQERTLLSRPLGERHSRKHLVEVANTCWKTVLPFSETWIG